jgi:hypothetical protein
LFARLKDLCTSVGHRWFGLGRIDCGGFRIVERTLLSAALDLDLDLDFDLSSRAKQDGEQSEPPCGVEGPWVRFVRSHPRPHLHSPAPKRTKDAQDGGPAANAVGPFLCLKDRGRREGG